METHRFVRKQRTRASASSSFSLSPPSSDLYDLNLRSSHDSFPDRTSEYWTNGTTTILSVPASPVVNQTSYQGFAVSAHQRIRIAPLANTPTPASTTSTEKSRLTRNRPRPMTARRIKDEPPTRNVIRNSLLAGSAAGMASTILCHPFDVLRVKMQSTALAATTATTATHNSASLGVAGTFRDTLRFGGVRALYTGLAMPLAAQAVYKGTVFTVNNITQKFIKEWKTQENYKLGNFSPHKLNMMDRFLCGFMGGAVNGALFVTPVEYVRNQLIAQTGSDKTIKNPTNIRGSARGSFVRAFGPLAVVRNTVKSEGLRGLWRGMASTVLRDSIGCGFFFTAMAYSQDKLSSRYHDPDAGPPSHSVLVASGAIAGVSFWIVALPLDTMKTWIQSGTARNLRHSLELSQQNGFLQSIVALNRGWQVAYGRGAPSAAVTVTTYSLVFNFLNQGTN